MCDNYAGNCAIIYHCSSPIARKQNSLFGHNEGADQEWIASPKLRKVTFRIKSSTKGTIAIKGPKLATVGEM